MAKGSHCGRERRQGQTPPHLRLPICFLQGWLRLPICFFPGGEKAKRFRHPICFLRAWKKQNGSDFQLAFSRAGKSKRVQIPGLEKAKGSDFQSSNLLFPGPGKSKMVQTSNLLFPGPGKSKRLRKGFRSRAWKKQKPQTSNLPICFFPGREKAKWFRHLICFFPGLEKAKGSDFQFAFSRAGKKQNGSDIQFAFSRAWKKQQAH